MLKSRNVINSPIGYGVIAFLASALFVACGIAEARAFSDSADNIRKISAANYWGLCRWDGEWYDRIAEHGYEYDPNAYSSVAFFPAFPVLARLLRAVTQLPANALLLIAANVFMLSALVIFSKYMAQVGPTRITHRERTLGVWSYALFPTTIFCHLCYTESMLLVLLFIASFGIRRGWHPVVLSGIAGLASGTRSTGVALLLPLSIYVVRRRMRMGAPDRRAARAVACAVEAAGMCVVACWGLICFMCYQEYRFGDALLFIRAQASWHERNAPADAATHLLALFTAEPIRAVYTAGCPCHWLRHGSQEALLNIHFANPIYFMGTALCLALGAAKRWIDVYELSLGAMLLIIPYTTQSYRMCMMSHGRFAVVAFPAFVVIGKLLARLPGPVAGHLLLCSGGLLATYAACFAAGYAIL